MTDDWRDALQNAGELTPSIVQRILTEHGDRGQRAIEAVSERRVKEYNDFTVVVGHHDEYVVENGGCHCQDSTYNIDTDQGQRCWHALAADIAHAIDELDHHDMYYSDVRDFI
ncbi:hypothetical protein [Salarchaeum japonicum]|uniref:SWIM-type domain-containing protein n=1 Tax=Salarchaeum japonicum TaxID=555573 RepID=A0AAV3SZK7_9EURY|nr:hypothetical protein [Salarchaeum japonicum]